MKQAKISDLTHFFRRSLGFDVMFLRNSGATFHLLTVQHCMTDIFSFFAKISRFPPNNGLNWLLDWNNTGCIFSSSKYKEQHQSWETFGITTERHKSVGIGVGSGWYLKESDRGWLDAVASNSIIVFAPSQQHASPVRSTNVMIFWRRTLLGRGLVRVVYISLKLKTISKIKL